MARLNRRRYAEMVKFLKDTIANEKAPTRMRMMATTKLDSIYERQEQMQEAETIRRERKERITAAQTAQATGAAIEPDEVVEEPSTVQDRRITGIFAEILNKPRPAFR